MATPHFHSPNTSRTSPVCSRLVRVPIVFFCLSSIAFQLSMQFKVAFQVNQNVAVKFDHLSHQHQAQIYTDKQQNDTAFPLESMKRTIEVEQNTNVLNYDENFVAGDGDAKDDYVQEQNKIGNFEGRGARDQHDTSFTSESVNDFVPTVTPSKIGSKPLITKSVDKRKKKKRKTRVIFGIMSYDSKSERQRRGLIRSTFLSYFTKHMNRTLVSEEEYNEKKHWICSLNDLDKGRLQYPEKCRMAYAFVQGANPNGPTMLLNFNESYPLSLPPSASQTENDKKDALDTVYLNIKENGRLGKSPTWFLYATDVLERHGWTNDFDYIFKSDTDNVLYTPNFFRFMDKLPRKRVDRVYGGWPLDYKRCGGDKHDHCKDMIGPLFMGGGCYFLSVGLAKFISDETTFDHLAVKIPHEDMTTGNFVYSHPEKIRIVKEPRKKQVFRFHPAKRNRQFKFRWNKMLAQEQLFLSTGRAY